MILLVQNNNEYENDLRTMISAFFIGEKIRVATPAEVSDYKREIFGEFRFVLTALFDDSSTRLRIEEKGYVRYSAYAYGNFHNRKRYRNRLKLASYRLLSEYTKRLLPWGSLTGMRPTKIAMAGLEKGKSRDEIIDYYQVTYETSREKAELATDVAISEKKTIDSVNPLTDYCLYVGIPFCPTRCLYCSFAAYPIHEYESKVGDYINALKKELPFISFLNRNRRLAAIYIGGGTPTSLSPEQLEEVMGCIKDSFDLSNLREYTVEAGRPDSITKEKLEVMKKYGCTRISINPQTMNEKTLRTIGRAHTPADIKKAFHEARKAGFKDINMDIIAGLPDELLEDMEYTLSEIEALGPESLTVHSLAIKRAADLNQEFNIYKNKISHDMDKMISLAMKKSEEMDMKPYYLYRQKNIAGNLENTGYSKPGRECIYNVLIMEEKVDTFAAGAGAVTRLLNIEDGEVTRIDRVENVKNVDEYINRLDEMLERKSMGVDSRILTINE